MCYFLLMFLLIEKMWAWIICNNCDSCGLVVKQQCNPLLGKIVYIQPTLLLCVLLFLFVFVNGLPKEF
jgi:hypothetical protein